MDDYELQLRQCLPVLEESPASATELDQAAYSAQQYLLAVRAEAAAYPVVLLPENDELVQLARAERNTSDAPPNQHASLSIEPSPKPNNCFDPHWAAHYSSTFSYWNSSFQKYLENTQDNTVSATHERFWKTICFSEGNSRDSVNSKLLTVKYLSGLNKKQSLRILEWFCKWVTNNQISYKQAYSIFLLLLRLDPLLTNQELYILRLLSRKLISIRNFIPDRNNPQSVYLNIIISIISTTFGQQDLI